MVSFLIALAILVMGGLVSLAVGRGARAAALIGAGSAVFGGSLVMLLSLYVLVSGHSLSLRLAWPTPLGSANMELDPLSAIFAAIISLVTTLAAVYGSQYGGEKGDSPHLCEAPSGPFRQMGTVPFFSGTGKNQGVSWLFFNLLTVGMLVVVAARNGVLFLMSWESCRSLPSSS